MLIELVSPTVDDREESSLLSSTKKVLLEPSRRRDAQLEVTMVETRVENVIVVTVFCEIFGARVF